MRERVVITTIALVPPSPVGIEQYGAESWVPISFVGGLVALFVFAATLWRWQVKYSVL